MSRKQSREVAFKVLFSLTHEYSHNMTSTFVDDGLIHLASNEYPQGPEAAYIKNLCKAVYENLEQIDQIIKKHSHGFTLERIYKTDLTALRMAIAEIKFVGTPSTVAINEAVEIAKKYGTDKSGGFVNGILAAVVK